MPSLISTADSPSPSDIGQRRLLSKRGEPLFLARWDNAVFINYAADAAVLQRQVPFELDLREGQALVSIVAFTLVRMRPRLGGVLSELLFKPIATHHFLNIRTYVRHRGEPGIYFLAEWLNNRLSVLLGPRSFGLPYRFGRLAFLCEPDVGRLRGTIESAEGRLSYQGKVAEAEVGPCPRDSLTEFMLERYTAFTEHREHRRLFRIWHSPWPQAAADIKVTAESLLASTGPWWKTARYIGGNYSPGVAVLMGRPHRIHGRTASITNQMARNSASTVKQNCTVE